MSTTSTAGKTDVVSLVSEQHQQVRSLFAQLKGASGEVAEQSFNELRRMLAIHETAEEEIVYPVLMSTGEEGKRIAEERKKEEGQAKTALAGLEKMGTSDAGFPAALEEFRVDVDKHATAEEREVLPLLQKSQTPDQLEHMAKLFDLAEKAAPTHPHPNAPESAMGNLLLGPAVAIMDRVRDAIRGGQ